MKIILLFCLLTLPLNAHPDPSHTLAHLEEHLAEKPNDPELLSQKADLLLATKHPELARPVVASLLALDSTKPENLLLDARLALLEKNTTVALTKAKALIISHPEFERGWNFLARVADQGDDRDTAITAMRRSLLLDPKPSPTDVMTCAAWLRDRAKPGDAESAISILDQGLVKLGVLTGLHHEAIRLELDLKRYDSALRRIDALTTRFRPSVDLSLHRAEILEQAGRYQDAATACDSALALLDLLPAKSKNSPEFRARMEEIARRKETNSSKNPNH